jgi:hypothetical protein
LRRLPQPVIPWPLAWRSRRRPGRRPAISARFDDSWRHLARATAACRVILSEPVRHGEFPPRSHGERRDRFGIAAEPWRNPEEFWRRPKMSPCSPCLRGDDLLLRGGPMLCCARSLHAHVAPSNHPIRRDSHVRRVVAGPLLPGTVSGHFPTASLSVPYVAGRAPRSRPPPTWKNAAPPESSRTAPEQWTTRTSTPRSEGSGPISLYASVRVPTDR